MGEPLPLAHSAWGAGTNAPGLVAAGQDLSPERLREAYSKGIFPWFSQSQPVLWWSTEPRMVLMVDEFRIHRSFKKTLTAFISNPNCEIRMDTAFTRVIENCAQRKSKTGAENTTSGTWIVPQMQSVYGQAHAQGFVHSVETWIDNELVGGLYCVCLGKAVYGESMFSLKKDVSKIALAALVAFSKASGIAMIDCQQNTSHLSSLGAREIPRSRFLEMSEQFQSLESPRWQFSPDYWRVLGPAGGGEK